jgi:hypothetical protein
LIPRKASRPVIKALKSGNLWSPLRRYAAMGSQRMALLFPERAGNRGGFLSMETPQDYRKFANECRRLAKQVKDGEHRAILEEMAEVWLRLAAAAAPRGSAETGEA